MTNINQKQISSAQEYLKAAAKLIEDGNNEQVVRDNFTSYLRTIFPDIPTWITEHVVGGEAALKTKKAGKETTGFVDNLIGLTPIEYEGDLTNTAKFSEGYGQVQKYCASLINEGHDPSQIVGILSDTVRWHAYRIESVEAAPGNVEGEHVHLLEIDSVDASAASELDARRLVDFLLKYIQRLGSRPLAAFSIARDLGFDSPFCSRHISNLTGVVAAAFEKNPEYADLIKNLWCNFVSYVSAKGKTSSFDSDEYTRELYILTLGKLICANALEATTLLSDDRELKDILSGDFFKTRGLENFVEYDYFGWLNSSDGVTDQLLTVAREIQQDLRAYSFEKIPSEDIFGQLMAQLAERSQRILLGQEWTPAWLAHSLVANTISKLPNGTAPHFIDMCCGSGAMVLETVKQAKELLSGTNLSDTEKIESLVRSVTGFDIDPLAVMLARISWVLAAKDLLLPLGTHRVTIPIYHADSLFATTPLSKNDDNDEEKITLSLAEYEIELPSFLITAGWQGSFDFLIDRAYAIAIQPTRPTISPSDMSSVVDKALEYAPNEVDEAERESLMQFLGELIDKVHTLHSEGRNGIWAFILRNNYRPGLVAGQFNGLVSNPPWLALSKIADNPYKKALGEMAGSLGIKPQGSSFLHVEMSTVFLLRSIDRYLDNDARIGCVVPDAVLNGNQHTLFREGAYRQAERPVPFVVDEIWHVDERAFKNRAAVLFGVKSNIDAATEIPGQYVAQDGSTQPLQFKTVTMGTHVVWTDRNTGDTAGIFHPADFEQGADIMPRRLFFHEVNPSGRQGMVELTPIERGSSPLTFLVNDAKQCKDFRVATPCVVPDRFIYDILLSKLVSPFMVADSVKAFLPIKRDESGTWTGYSEAELQVNADDETALRVFRTLSAEIGKLDKNDSPEFGNVWSRLNYRNKIGKQNFDSSGYLVLTGAGGSDVCSALVALENYPDEKLIIDQTLYWAWVGTREEALYLTGMLNSEAANESIKAFQPRGQQGERHVHELAFNITPPFDNAQELHAEVVRTTDSLIKEYRAHVSHAVSAGEDWVQWLDPSKDLARRRSKLRDIIRSLPSYGAYSAACAAVYGV